MNKLIYIVSIILLTMIPVISAEYTDEYKELSDFLNSDNTNIIHQGKLSSISAYYLTENASYNNISLGMVKLYNPDARVAYFFCYYIYYNEEYNRNSYIFIDPETDRIYSFSNARYRLYGIDISETIYYRYYPYSYNEGSGYAPDWMIRCYNR